MLRSHDTNGRGAPALVCHTALYSGDHPRNSLAGVAECIERGVSRIEIDIHSLDGADYAIYHERRLEAETTARGPIGSASADDVRGARFSAHPDERLPLLSEVIDMALAELSARNVDLRSVNLEIDPVNLM